MVKTAPVQRYVKARVNGGDWVGAEIRLDHELIEVTSATATKPSMSWERTDQAGHWHAFDSDGELPTLRESVRIEPCSGGCGDPGCEGMSVTEYFCRVCDEQVTPVRVPDVGPKFIRGQQRWTAVVYAPVPWGNEQVQVRLDVGDRLLFGFGVVTEVEGTPTGGRSVIEGVTKLGSRPKPDTSALPAVRSREST